MNRTRLLVALLAFAAAVAPAVAVGSDAQRVRLTVSLSGDLLIHSSVLARALALGGGETYEFEPMLEEVRPWIEGPDLAFCHVETPITELAPPAGYPRFNTPPALAETIAAMGWDACSTASNHSLDQGAEGIAATAQALDRVGVGHTGSFTSARVHRRPLILRANGVRVALLSYTTNTNNHPLPAPYSVNLAGDPAEVIADARRARRAGADAVIVNIHWTPTGLLWTPAIAIPGGSAIAPEYVASPSPAQVDLVEALIGADEITAVVGQGPHVVQPIRKVGGEYAVFSEGNLISGQSPAAGITAASQDGLIALLKLAFDGDRASVERVRYVPVFVLRPAHLVLPVGGGNDRGLADPAALADSYGRTVSIVGRGAGIEPVPAKSP